MPTPVTVSRSRWILASHSNITPCRSWYTSRPASTCSVQRASRSRFLTFWDFAYVQDHSVPSRITYQSGMRWGHPRGPIVAHVTTRSSSRNASTSASDIVIASRRLTAAEAIGCPYFDAQREGGTMPLYLSRFSYTPET